MRKRTKCTDPNCVNFAYSTTKPICDACRAFNAMKYIPMTAKRKRRKYDWQFVIKIQQNDPTRSRELDSWFQEISRETFCNKYVAWQYVTVFFKYPLSRDRGLVFKDDKSVITGTSRWKNETVAVVIKDGFFYVFGETSLKTKIWPKWIVLRMDKKQFPRTKRVLHVDEYDETMIDLPCSEKGVPARI